MFELLPGTRIHYDLKLIDRCYRRWEMMGKPGEFPDIRKVAMEDQHYDSDMWYYHQVVLWRQQNLSPAPAKEDAEDG